MLTVDLHKQRNKAVIKSHERLTREMLKARGDDHQRRMDLLRANDFEAYQEMLRLQAVGGGPLAGVGRQRVWGRTRRCCGCRR